MRRRIRELLGDQLARNPVPRDAPVPLDVRHRAFLRAMPEVVWRLVSSPRPGLDVAAGCVRVLGLPHIGDSASGNEVVALWRRPNGRLRAGLSELVDLRPGLAVTRRVDDALPLVLSTTIDAFDDGCVVEQHLRGRVRFYAEESTRRWAALWMERALLRLRAHVEAVAIPSADLAHSQRGIDELETTPTPGVVPVAASASVTIDVDPQHLWDFLSAALSEPLISPSLQHVLRTTLDDEAGDHLVSVHARTDGSRQVHVTQLVEATPPSRLVERSLTAEHEGDVLTSITPAGPGCIVTETFTGWLPPGAGATSGTGPVAAHLQTRLETIKRLAEAGVQPQRDPRTGFLPPGSSPQPPSQVASSPILPASVILPPPHLLVPAPAYVRDPDRWAWDAALTVLPFGGDFG